MKNLLFLAMNSMKQFFLVMSLGAGVCIAEVKADKASAANTSEAKVDVISANDVNAKIRNTVQAHRHEIVHIKNSNQLNAFLAKLKNEILSFIEKIEDLTPQHQALKDALIKLNPSDKFSIAANIKQILDNLESDVSAIIKNAIPPVYRTILNI